MIDKNIKSEFNQIGWRISLEGNIISLTNKVTNSSEIRFWKDSRYYCAYKVFNRNKIIEEIKSGFKKYYPALRYLKRMAFGHVYQLMEK